MKKGIKYHTYLVEDYLKDSERAAGYLREAILEGDLELLRAVVGDLIETGYENFQVNVNKSDVNGEIQYSLDVETTQRVLEVKSKRQVVS